jgi:excinuclease UvrABC nuclease subunit
MIPRKPGCYILNHVGSGMFYIGSTSDLYRREISLMSTLNLRTNLNTRLQELYLDDPNVIFEYLVTPTREDAFILEQQELDKWLGHPKCLNSENDLRWTWHASSSD